MSFAYSEGDLAAREPVTQKPPFDTERLDRLMEEAGLDAVLITSKHNIQYFLGGYRFFFYDYMDAHGLSRYLPFFVYIKGKPLESAYVGCPMEKYEKQLGSFWVLNSELSCMTGAEFAAAAAKHLRDRGHAGGRIGIEVAFMPVDANAVLQAALPDAKLVDATFQLEILRARKSKEELAILRQASEKVVDSMLAVIATHGAGATKRQLIEALRREEIDRGLKFEYALTNMGTSFNRAPHDQVWKAGDPLALDSGGNYKGYIGDLTRMAYVGTPDQELVDLLGEIETIQQAARKGLRPGARGGDIFAWAHDAQATCSARDHMFFVAHGMGIVSHEAPWLTNRAPVPYPAYHANRPLEAGMVLSVETELHHPRRGFIKLEDTIAITDDGWEAYGDHGRGWNIAGE